MYKKQVKTTLSGDLLRRFRFFANDESMRESEALRYLVSKGLKEQPNKALQNNIKQPFK
jgi:hypothetical protein